jgi:hypothetical protein
MFRAYPAEPPRVGHRVMGGMKSRRTAAIVLAAALTVPLLIGATRLLGWGSDDPAGRSGTPADAQELRDFVAILQNGREATYTATYATASGVVVSAAQEAPQRVYRSTTAVYVSGPDANVVCRMPAGEQPGCHRSAGTDGIPLTHARALTEVLATDFIAPELVSSYLSRMAARVPGPVVRSTRDVAGQATECVEMAGVVTACATADGVLAHFESPDGRLTLTALQPSVSPDAFALPTGAAVTDLDG